MSSVVLESVHLVRFFSHSHLQLVSSLSPSARATLVSCVTRYIVTPTLGYGPCLRLRKPSTRSKQSYFVKSFDIIHHRQHERRTTNQRTEVIGRRHQLGHLPGSDAMGHGLKNPVRPPDECINARSLQGRGNDPRSHGAHTMG